jgi:RimJ/RimL family protein N-acetyltransferase
LDLRAHEAGDVDAIYEACQDPEILCWIPNIPRLYTRKNAEEFVASVTTGWENDTDYTFVAIERATNELVATVGLHQSRTEGVGEVGFWCAPAARHKGITKEAVAAVAEWAFARGFHRLEWYAQVGNQGSLGVANTLGFVQEGVLREKIFNRGQWVDAWVASLFEEELVKPA